MDFVVFGAMTLKEGRQKEHFMEVLRRARPDLLMAYGQLYHPSPWGGPVEEYIHSLNALVVQVARHYGMPLRMPPVLYRDMLDENDLVAVTLESIDYLLKLRGAKTPFGYAAYMVSHLKEPLAGMRPRLRSIKGVGPAVENVILDVLNTGQSRYYQRLTDGQA